MKLVEQIQPYLERLKQREITNRAVARELGYSEAHISRTLRRLKFKKDPPPDRTQQSALYRARQEHRHNISHTLPPKQAAAAANCSLRTIYRLRAKAQT